MPEPRREHYVDPDRTAGTPDHNRRAGASTAWPDGTRVTVLEPNEYAGMEGEVIDWNFAFASDSRRYWIQLDERGEPVHVHESELRRGEPS
jgi:hypothetical protein